MNQLLKRSLTLRLTLLFALASALVLLLLGLLIGRSVERHFEELDLSALSGKMQLARQVLEQALDKPSDTMLTQQLDTALTGHHDLAIVIIGPMGQRVYSNTELTLPPELLGAAFGQDPTLGQDQTLSQEQTHRHDQAAPIKWLTVDGFPWRGMATQLVSVEQPYTIVVAIDISHHEHFMSAFRQTLWVFMALAALAMGLLGWIVVRQGLAPLQAIKRQAAEITANRLDTRLSAETIPLELANLASALNEMLSRLEESFQRLSDFSSDLAHELRTPVSNLLTQTQVTLSKARTADEYRDILASNVEEFEVLSRMIADMLLLAKAENKQLLAQSEQLELATEVASLLEFYGVLAEEQQIRLSGVGQGTVAGDRLMLRRAISNLLSNALRYTPQGGTVRVLIEPEQRDVQIQGRVLLTVENTGPTIPPEHLSRLFDRFYRTDSARHKTTEGSGLGLAITRSIVLAHGGDISVSSADGVTRFTLSLPAADTIN